LAQTNIKKAHLHLFTVILSVYTSGFKNIT